MVRVVAKEGWLKGLAFVKYISHVGQGYWLADVPLHYVLGSSTNYE